MPSSRPPSPSKPTAAPAAVDPQTVRRIRLWLLAVAVVVALLIFAVPGVPPPPATPASPNQAFVDEAGMVSPGFARETAGWLLNTNIAEIVVYTAMRPPEGDLAAWTVQAATDWKVGTAKNDTGFVLFVFREPRLVRAEVGYGLEGQLPDARVRQLIEEKLLPAFAQGAYERGFDAFLLAVRDELGGAAAMAKAAAAEVQAPRPGFVAQMPDAFARAPRLAVATWRNFVEGGPYTRLAILVFVGVGLGVVVAGAALGVAAVWTAATLPRRWRASSATTTAGRLWDANPIPIAIGLAGFWLCLSLTTLILMEAEGFLTRKGHFGGGGVALTWPAPPAR